MYMYKILASVFVMTSFFWSYIVLINQNLIFQQTQACAECFMSVSTASPATMRKNELSQCFVSLLCDKSRWVCTQKLH